jgi:hypothetical protein
MDASQHYLRSYKIIAAMLGAINFDAVARETPENAKLRLLFTTMMSHIPEDDIKTGNMNAEQIYLTPLAWAYFSAYQTVLYVAYARAKVLSVGLEDPTSLLATEPLRAILKAALPQRAEYIDSQPVSTHHLLIEELEQHILGELRVMLEGREDDQAAISQAVEIMEQVNKARAALDHHRANAGIETWISSRRT